MGRPYAAVADRARSGLPLGEPFCEAARVDPEELVERVAGRGRERALLATARAEDLDAARPFAVPPDLVPDAARQPQRVRATAAERGDPRLAERLRGRRERHDRIDRPLAVAAREAE